MFRPVSLARRAFCSRCGGAAIEFAIICPLIFATVLGTFETGRALYERNKLNAACAFGVRALAVHGPSDETSVREAIEARFTEAQRDRLDISIDDETIDGASFKKLQLTYNHELLIHFTRELGELQFTVTRYAPAIAAAD